MIHVVQLGRAYFAGESGVRIVHQDGTEQRISAGYPVVLATWPTTVEGQLIDSRGFVVQIVADRMRRVAEDKAVTFG